VQDFYRGQKVECIDDTPRQGGGGVIGDSLGPLKAGHVYTIRWHGFISGGRFASEYKVRVEEIYRKKRRWWKADIEDTPYLAARFRPIDLRKADKVDPPINVKKKELVP